MPLLEKNIESVPFDILWVPNFTPTFENGILVEGKLVSQTFMEDKLEWHYKSPNQEQYEMALKELGDSKWEQLL